MRATLYPRVSDRKQKDNFSIPTQLEAMRDPVVKTFLPLLPWHLQKVLGPVLKPAEWRALALSLVPPPFNVVNIIIRKFGDWDSPSLLSAAERRRIRNAIKRDLRHDFRDDSRALLVRHWLVKWRKGLEASGYTSDPAHTGKMADLVNERSEYYAGLAGRTELSELLGSVSPERAHDAAALLWELALYGEAEIKPKLRPNSALWTIIGIEPREFEGINPEEVLDACYARFKNLLGLDDGLPDEARLLQLQKWMVKAHRPSDQEPETTPEALSKATIAGLIHKPIVIKDKETGKVVEMDIEDTSALQVGELSEADGREAIIEAFAHKGIGYNDLTPNEWQEIFERHDLIRKGLEFSSKTGVSISSFYGTGAHAKEQKWSRINKKIRKLSK